MKERLVAALALGAFALLLLGTPACALLEPQASIRKSVQAGAGQPQRLFAGAAKVALTPVQRAVPLAGFGPSPVFAVRVSIRGLPGRATENRPSPDLNVGQSVGAASSVAEAAGRLASLKESRNLLASGDLPVFPGPATTSM